MSDPENVGDMTLQEENNFLRQSLHASRREIAHLETVAVIQTFLLLLFAAWIAVLIVC